MRRLFSIFVTLSILSTASISLAEFSSKTAGALYSVKIMDQKSSEEKVVTLQLSNDGGIQISKTEPFRPGEAMMGRQAPEILFSGKFSDLKDTFLKKGDRLGAGFLIPNTHLALMVQIDNGSNAKQLLRKYHLAQLADDKKTILETSMMDFEGLLLDAESKIRIGE